MRVLCIGSAMIDIIVMVESRNIERMTMHNAPSSFLLLEQGAKVEAESISIHCGGGAVNASVAMRRLGAESAVLARIGRDGNGALIVEFLTQQGVDTTCLIHTDEDSTGQAVLVSSHDRNQTIFTQRGANGSIRAEELAKHLFAARDLVYVSALSNRSADCFPHIMKQAMAAGAFVSANPGIRQITSRTEALLSSVAGLGLLAVNRVEANALVPAVAARAVGRPARRLAAAAPAGETARLMRLGLSFGGFDMGLAAFLSGLMAVSGIERCAITDGIEGAFLADGTGLYYHPSVPVEVMGTAGAGDAFTATLSLMLASGAEPAHALKSAAVNSASVVTHSDTTHGLLDRDAIEARIVALEPDLPVQFQAWVE
jgi:sugar/nucleoside kinase (ribokinase family)